MTTQSPQDFDQYYLSQIRPVLAKLERKRKRILSKVAMVGVGLCILIAVVAAILAFNRIPPLAALFGLIPALIIFAVTTHFMTRDYKAHFKAHVMGAVARYFDPSLKYSAGGSVSLSHFVGSGMFQTQPDRYSGEDFVSGTLGKTAVQFSEIHAEYKTVTYDSKGNRQETWVTIFRGLFFVGDFNKEIKGTTVVHPDVAERLLGRVGKMLQSLSTTFSDAELIKLEDPEFEKHFVVYGDDQVEARYILTPNLMRRILNFREVTGRGLHLSFTGQNVYVGVSSTRDMFEPRVFRTVFSRKLIKGYVADMAMAVGVVEELNLNRRIWTKR